MTLMNWYKTRWKLKGRKWNLLLIEFVNARNEWKMQIKTQLKPIIWYTSWYFSRGGGDIKKIPLFTPLIRFVLKHVASVKISNLEKKRVFILLVTNQTHFHRLFELKSMGWNHFSFLHNRLDIHHYQRVQTQSRF